MDTLIIPQTTLKSKPANGIITIRAEQTVTSQDRHGVKVEVFNPDVWDLLEQIGIESIFEYWSPEMIQKEVERYAHQEQTQMAI